MNCSNYVKTEEVRYYILYYYPLSFEKRDRFRLESPSEIKKWVDNSNNIDAVIEGESLWIRRNGENIVQFKFHWRNVFLELLPHQ